MRSFKMTRRTWIPALAVIMVPLLALGLYLGYLQLSGNFHIAADGELYRSAQPTAVQLRNYAKTYGIKTVLNLRGSHPNSGWYDDEVAEARLLGITHVDFRMSARKELTQAEVDRLVAILRQSPKPILVHCQSGADRSGLVSAIFLREIDGVDVETAGAQISLYYGHIGVPYFSSTYAMDRTWRKLEQIYRDERKGGKL